MSGADIKKRIKGAGLKVWQVAKAYGVTDATFSRKLRNDFDEESTKRVLDIIESLKQN